MSSLPTGLHYIGTNEDDSSFPYLSVVVQHTPPPYPCMCLTPPERTGKPYTGWNMASESTDLCATLRDSAMMLMVGQDRTITSSKDPSITWQFNFNTLYVCHTLWSRLSVTKRRLLESVAFLCRMRTDHSARIVVCDVPSSHYD